MPDETDSEPNPDETPTPAPSPAAPSPVGEARDRANQELTQRMVTVIDPVREAVAEENLLYAAVTFITREGFAKTIPIFTPEPDPATAGPAELSRYGFERNLAVFMAANHFARNYVLYSDKTVQNLRVATQGNPNL